MSLLSRMRELCEVWERAAESDEWTQTKAGVPLSIVAVPLAGSRQETAPRYGALRADGMLDPQVTHTARTTEAATTFARGQRLRRIVDGAEWVIRSVRLSAQVGVAHTQLGLMQAEPHTGGTR